MFFVGRSVCLGVLLIPCSRRADLEHSGSGAANADAEIVGHHSAVNSVLLLDNDPCTASHFVLSFVICVVVFVFVCVC